MNFAYNNQFGSFYEFACDGFRSEMSDFRSVRGRVYCLKALFQKILFLPFALVLKMAVTLFRGVGMVMGLVFLVASFGTSEGAREFFFRRVLFLAKDLADWVLFPFVVIVGIFKLFLGSTLHPAIYFH